MRFTRGGDTLPGERAVGIAPAALGPCDACRTRSAKRAKAAVGDVLVVLCVDAPACCDRYRGHTSPESYAAALRGELLGVAP